MNVDGKLAGRVAIVVGGGQSAGETTGNGRAACLTYAREGARVLVVDRDLASAEQTVKLVREDGGLAQAHLADITSDEDCRGIPDAALTEFGRIDILHNNVGIDPRRSDREPDRGAVADRDGGQPHRDVAQLRWPDSLPRARRSPTRSRKPP